ncbi:MAG: cyclic nucleotide-binding domain-containing protein [Enhygromyxa sp.]
MPTPWPDSLFAAPILRGLDDAARQAIVAAGRLRELEAGERVFAADELGDSFFVVARGEVELRARTRASLEGATPLRVAYAGETFGEEATLPGARRRSEAWARTPALVAEIPAPLFARALGRSGGDLAQTPEQRLLRRRASADLLRQISLGEALGLADFELLLDAAELHPLRRGERVYAAGDRPDGLWLIAHGLVQLQSEDPSGGVVVRAYLSDGDFFGDAELLAGQPRALTAVATGESQLLSIPPAAVRSLVDRNPGLVDRLRRITSTRDARQAAALEAAPHATRHVFADLYRMQMARSLLTIDQDACVRCGHCAWSCEQVHGVARLVRRGDKVVTALRVADSQAAARELLLPNSCQHCKNPVCMLDCPTGAIGREGEGEVFIRESLCTGCGNCAKACPWENIRMAPRRLAARGAIPRAASLDGTDSLQLWQGLSAPGFVAETCSTPGTAAFRLRASDENPGARRHDGLHHGLLAGPASQQFGEALIAAAERRGQSLEAMFPEVATKCDLCREYEAPACVQACPTEAIIRLEPERDFAEVAAILDRPLARREGGRRRIAWGALGVAAAAGLGVAGWVAATGLHARGLLHAASGPGLAAGVLAAVVMFGLVAHALPKRLVRAWMRPRSRPAGARALVEQVEEQAAPLPRSKLRPFYLAHLALGLLLPALVLAHAGFALPANAAGVLALLCWMSLALGLFGAACYAVIPRRLTRIEHGGALPEDLADERERLLDRLQRELSGKSPVLKRLAAEHLLPWAREPLGPLRLLLSGRDLAGERARLRERIEAWLPPELREDAGHPHARAEALVGLEPLLRTIVELRALPLRRLLSAALRGWLVPHVLLTGALLVGLVAHVLLVTLFTGA